MSDKAESDVANRRNFYRVPVFSNSGLHCQLQAKNSVVTARVTNLSVSGMAVRVTPEEALSWSEGDEVAICLQMRQHVFECRGTVQRLGYGIVSFRFPVVGQPSDYRPPELLGKMVMALQRNLLVGHLKQSEQSEL